MVVPGGGGGTQIWFGQGCATEASEPIIPMLTLGVILAKKVPILVTLSPDLFSNYAHF